MLLMVCALIGSLCWVLFFSVDLLCNASRAGLCYVVAPIFIACGLVARFLCLFALRLDAVVELPWYLCFFVWLLNVEFSVVRLVCFVLQCIPGLCCLHLVLIVVICFD